MNRLPQLRQNEAQPDDRMRLERWLIEWQLDRGLADRRPGQSRRQDRLHVVPDHDALPVETVRAGDILLLAPRETWAGPLFLAILRRDGADSFVCVPFSRFGEPALPGEWKTSRRAIYLRVLCLWNAVTVSGRTLRSGWLAGTCTDEEIRGAEAVDRYVSRGTPLPEAVAAAVGPPLLHPADPRWLYIEQETERLCDCLDSDARLPMVREPARPFPEPSTLMLAAEPHPPFGRQVSFAIADFDLVLVITDAPAPDLPVAMIQLPSGERSRRFDGGTIAA
ncbi:MAG: hypothetical protein O3A51_04915, partial [Verrucomicrobia bacterium]|nr:hypothetical protein [Verrucomicrobiota bacterium]